MENLKDKIASNIIRLRKSKGMTQGELAEKINYSDKSVSKWERGESIPDVETIVLLSNIFGVSVDELVNQNLVEKKISNTSMFISKKYLIPILSVGLCWLVATVVFVFLKIFLVDFSREWLCFVYAIPSSAIVSIVFSALWGNELWLAICVSALSWSFVTALVLTIEHTLTSLLFLICIPFQILIVLWYVMKYLKKKNKKKEKSL